MARRAGSRRRTVAVLDGKRYLALLDTPRRALADAAAAARPRPTPPRTPAQGRAARTSSGSPTCIEQALELRPGADRDLALHDARKAAKRTRYAAEAADRRAGQTGRRRFAKRMKAVQTLLGDHQDSVVAREALRDLAAQAHAAGETAFTWGCCTGSEEATRRRPREAGAVPRCWAKRGVPGRDLRAASRSRLSTRRYAGWSPLPAHESSPMSVESVFPQLEALLPHVQKPIQYVGGELNSTVKPWDELRRPLGADVPGRVRGRTAQPGRHDPLRGAERARGRPRRAHVQRVAGPRRADARAQGPAVHRGQPPPGEGLRRLRAELLHRAGLHEHADRPGPRGHPAGGQGPRRSTTRSSSRAATRPSTPSRSRTSSTARSSATASRPSST